MIWRLVCLFTGHWWKLTQVPGRLPGWECRVCGLHKPGVIESRLVH